MLTAWSCIEASVAVDMLAIAQQMRDQRPVLIQTPVSISHLYITCNTPGCSLISVTHLCKCCAVYCCADVQCIYTYILVPLTLIIEPAHAYVRQTTRGVESGVVVST